MEGEPETASKLLNGTSFKISVTFNRDFNVVIVIMMPNNSKMVQDRAKVVMADHQKVVYDLSNGAVFNDLEQPQTQISRSGHSLTLNIFKIAKDTIIVAVECE